MLITRLGLSEMLIPCKCVNHATTRGHDADCCEKHADKGEAFRRQYMGTEHSAHIGWLTLEDR